MCNVYNQTADFSHVKCSHNLWNTFMCMIMSGCVVLWAISGLSEDSMIHLLCNYKRFYPFNRCHHATGLMVPYIRLMCCWQERSVYRKIIMVFTFMYKNKICFPVMVNEILLWLPIYCNKLFENKIQNWLTVQWKHWAVCVAIWNMVGPENL